MFPGGEGGGGGRQAWKLWVADNKVEMAGCEGHDREVKRGAKQDIPTSGMLPATNPTSKGMRMRKQQRKKKIDR